MHEIEIKLCYKKKSELTYKLEELGAKLVKEVEIKDKYFSKDVKNIKDAKEFVRIREKNGKAELTFKGKEESNTNVSKKIELNLDISDSKSMEAILEQLNFNIIRENKTKREYWEMDNVELVIVNIIEPVEIDYVEVEGPSEELVNNLVSKLGDCVKPIEKDHFKKMDEAKNQNENRN